jgi:hypothetical protein
LYDTILILIWNRLNCDGVCLNVFIKNEFFLYATNRITSGMYAFIKNTYLAGNKYLNTHPETGMSKIDGSQLLFIIHMKTVTLCS